MGKALQGTNSTPPFPIARFTSSEKGDGEEVEEVPTVIEPDLRNPTRSRLDFARYLNQVRIGKAELGDSLSTRSKVNGSLVNIRETIPYLGDWVWGLHALGHPTIVQGFLFRVDLAGWLSVHPSLIWSSYAT